MPTQNYLTGVYQAPDRYMRQNTISGAPGGAGAYQQEYGDWSTGGSTGDNSMTGVNAYRGTNLIGDVDWNDLSNVEAHAAGLRHLNAVQTRKTEYWNRPGAASGWGQYRDNAARRGRGEDIDPLRVPSHRDTFSGFGSGANFNPFYSQGLGPKEVTSRAQLSTLYSEFWNAQQDKFDNRANELRAIEAAGGPEGFAQLRTDRAALAVPHLDSMRAAELTRPSGGGGGGGGGGGALGVSRRVDSAKRSEGPTGASRSSSGTVARRRLRASSILSQPLGGGSQAASQVLG